MSTEKITIDTALSQLQALCSEHNGDLDKVFQHNGLTGHRATGTFSIVAKATGLSRSFVGKVLKGEVTPSMDTIDKLAGACNVPAKEIFEFIKRKQTEMEAA